ncbi:MAG: tetraacyldisaccharide 4'-kinase [Deltaproteobacteria bacterium]|nr:tetraacyldisaccharide 4'-kinase [Deltaproteobacteria bacterium]
MKIGARVEKLMREDRVRGMAHLMLLLLSYLYGLAVWIRGKLYSLRVLKAIKLPCRVISIGNMTVGGTGKTPMAIHAAHLLRAAGKKCVILSRGYKRESKGMMLVSDMNELLVDAGAAGDEPYLMAKRLGGVPVIVAEDRAAAGRYAVTKFAPDYIILDDGYQHRRLVRDVNLLLVDAKEGFGNGHLLPAGILREPISGIRRASFAIVKNPPLKDRDAARLAEFGIPAIGFSFKPVCLVNLSDGGQTPLSALSGKKVFAFAGLARAASFFESFDPLGARLTRTLEYRDHHAYTQSDIKDISAASSGADYVVTTEKDGVKVQALEPRSPIYALRITTVIEDEKGFARLLEARLPPKV